MIFFNIIGEAIIILVQFALPGYLLFSPAHKLLDANPALRWLLVLMQPPALHVGAVVLNARKNFSLYGYTMFAQEDGTAANAFDVLENLTFEVDFEDVYDADKHARSHKQKFIHVVDEIGGYSNIHLPRAMDDNHRLRHGMIFQYRHCSFLVREICAALEGYRGFQSILE